MLRVILKFIILFTLKILKFLYMYVTVSVQTTKLNIIKYFYFKYIANIAYFNKNCKFNFVSHDVTSVDNTNRNF